MKKVFALLLLVLMVFAFSITANAIQEEDLVFNGEITIHVPEGYYSLEKDIPEDSEKLKELGITKDEFLMILEDAEHLLTTEDLNTQIYIYCEKTDYVPFEFYTEAEKTEYISDLREIYKETGCDVLEAEILDYYPTPFTKISIAGGEDYVPMIIYNTVYNELDLTVILYHFGEGEISNAQEWVSDSLIYDLEFNNNNYVLKNTVPVEYAVEGIGTKFTLPKGWYLAGKSDGELMAVKSKNVAMLYFTYDSWDTFTEEEKSQVHRSDLNMDLFTEEDIKELIGSEKMKEEYLSFGMNIVEDSVYMMEIGGYNCAVWKIEGTEDYSVFDEATAIMYAENAIGHVFLFTGTFSGKMAEEYKGIVASAKFPEIPDEGGEKAESAEKSEGAAAARVVIKLLRYGIVGSVIAGLGSLIKNATKEIKDKKKSKEAEKQVVKEEEQENKFCRECGAQLDENDKFCPVCGTKVKK